MLVPTLQDGQTHSNNSLAIADESFEYVLPFCGLVTKGLSLLLGSNGLMVYNEYK